MGIESRFSSAPPLEMLFPEKFDASSPDTRLRIAVLDRAIRDIIDFHQSKRCAEAQAKRQAWSWLRSNTRNQGWLTFVDVCEALALDPDLIRKKIMEDVTSPEFIARFEGISRQATPLLPRMHYRRVVRYHKNNT